MDVDMAQQFRKAGIQMARDKRVRCVVVRGTGSVFCSGADLKYIRAHGNADDLGYLKPASLGATGGFGIIFKEILEYIHATISEMKRSPKPWIAAVNGVAAAGGFGIAMACDLVFAADSATFEWAYHKTGLTGAESSTFFLPRLVGLRTAMGLMMLNPRLTAAEAKEHRLINDVFPAATFDADVMRMAHQVAAGPTRAFGVAKSLINSAAGVEQLDFQLDRELDELQRIADGEDFAEGLAAFFEKRAPHFSGRDG
jgi:2-(1,2-epoxy-1,2-dihydrophenyl)acetyl-CoA isomerase